VALSEHRDKEMWDLMGYKDQKIRLAIPALLDAVKALEIHSEKEYEDTAFPLVLSAGERRVSNANQIYRDPHWRKKDVEGCLRIHPEDARQLGLAEGDRASCESKHGKVTVTIAHDNTMQSGHVSLPHGFGMFYPDPDEPTRMVQAGPAINQLTSALHCDPFAKTPFHKFVRVRLRTTTHA